MNKKLLIISLAFVALIGGSLIYLLTNQTDEPDTGPANTSTNQPSEREGEAESAGQYVDYSEDVIANTSGTKLLFFHAPWCPQCRALESDINSQGLPEDVTVIKVDYDSHQDLRRQYGVTVQTTVVLVDDDGNLIDKYVAYDRPTIANVLENLL